MVYTHMNLRGAPQTDCTLHIAGLQRRLERKSPFTSGRSDVTRY